MREDDRMKVDDLLNAPLISEEYSAFQLHKLDKAVFESEQPHKYNLPEACNSFVDPNAALGLANEPDVMDAEENAIFLTTLRSSMRDILVK